MVNTSIVLLSAALASGASAFTTNTRVSNNIHSSSTAMQAISSEGFVDSYSMMNGLKNRVLLGRGVSIQSPRESVKLWVEPI